MKKIVLVCAAAAVAAAVCGAEAAAGSDTAKKAPRKINPRELFYRHNGGMVKRPGTGAGRLTVVNAQSAADAGMLEAFAAEQARTAKIDVAVETGTFDFPPAAVPGDAAVFVVDDARLPALLAAPENRWTLVNVAPLRSGRGAKRAFFEARVRKELTRAFALLAGAQNSTFPGTVLGCVTDPEQLDKIADEQVPIDVRGRYETYLPGYGIRPFELVTYRKAVMEGWAPAPTNDVQRAVWEKVKNQK